jgi:hypothetical protein
MDPTSIWAKLQSLLGVTPAQALPNVSQIAPGEAVWPATGGAPSRFQQQAAQGSTYPVGLMGTLLGQTPPPTHDQYGRPIDPWGGLLSTPDPVADSLSDKFGGTFGSGWGIANPTGFSGSSTSKAERLIALVSTLAPALLIH